MAVESLRCTLCFLAFQTDFKPLFDGRSAVLSIHCIYLVSRVCMQQQAYLIHVELLDHSQILALFSMPNHRFTMPHGPSDSSAAVQSCLASCT